jgi:hypothetical protein
MIRTNPDLWSRVKAEVTHSSKGGLPGQWSARKAQLAVKLYKDRGGKYVGRKSSRNSLHQWTVQDWRTKSGKPSLVTGERYLPAKAIKHLSSAEYARTTRKKREGLRKGEQFTKQPKNIARKTRRYRKF